MKYHALTAAAIAAGLVAVPAQAQDLSGFRVEIRTGWDQVSANASLPNPDEDEDEDGDEFLTLSGKDSDITYGTEIGYDAQIGSGLVIGAYLGADISGARNCGELIEDDRSCLDLNRTFLAGVRAGIPLGSNSLLYAKGGYSNSKLTAAYDADITDNEDEEPGVIERFSKTKGAFHVGGGLELGLTSSLYAKVEYVYTDLGRTTFLLDGGAGEDPALSFGSDRHQVFAGVGLRF